VKVLAEKLRNISLWLENGEMTAKEASEELWVLAEKLSKAEYDVKEKYDNSIDGYLESLEKDVKFREYWGVETIETIKKIERLEL